MTIIATLSTDPHIADEFGQKVKELQGRLSNQSMNYRDWDTLTDKQQALFSTDLFLDGESARSVEDYVRVAHGACDCPDTQDDLEFHSPKLLDKLRKAQQAPPNIQVENLSILDEMIEQAMLTESSKGIAHDDKMGVRIQNSAGEELTLKRHYRLEVELEVDEDGNEKSNLLDQIGGESVEVLYSNNPTGRPPYRALVIVAEGDGGEYAFVRYTTSRMWTQTAFGRDTGWGVRGTTAETEALALKPSDLLPGDQAIPKRDLASIVGARLETASLSPITKASIVSHLQSIISGSSPTPIVFADEESRKVSLPAVIKYYGEIVAPLLLSVEHDALSPTSTIVDSTKHLLNPNKIDNYKQAVSLEWPSSVTHAMVDSYLHFAGGYKVGVSSKGAKGGGANPSIRSLLEVIEVAGRTPEQIKEMWGGSEILEHLYLALRSLGRLSSKAGPAAALYAFGLIGGEEYKMLESIYTSKDTDLSGKVSRDYFEKKTSKYFPVDERSKRSSRYSPYYHLLGALARQVESQVNNLKTESGEPAFTELAKIAYSQGAIVQIYADFAKGKTNQDGSALVEMLPFKLIYPARFEGSIRLDAGKNYMTTYVNGRLTVNIRH